MSVVSGVYRGRITASFPVFRGRGNEKVVQKRAIMFELTYFDVALIPYSAVSWSIQSLKC